MELKFLLFQCKRTYYFLKLKRFGVQLSSIWFWNWKDFECNWIVFIFEIEKIIKIKWLFEYFLFYKRSNFLWKSFFFFNIFYMLLQLCSSIFIKQEKYFGNSNIELYFKKLIDLLENLKKFLIYRLYLKK